MQLPSALAQTTLGDLLGTLHRGRAYGVLELVQDWAARAHRIVLWDGLVAGVVVSGGETPLLGDVLRRRTAEPRLGAAIDRALSRASDQRPLGERLVACGVISRSDLEGALIQSHRERLDWIDALSQASVRFHPLKASPGGRVLLGPHVFLHGRKRRRGEVRMAPSNPIPPNDDYAVFGLSHGSPFPEVQKAFRRSVLRCHPDRYAHLGGLAAARAERDLRRLLDSYERLRRENARVA